MAIHADNDRAGGLHYLAIVLFTQGKLFGDPRNNAMLPVVVGDDDPEDRCAHKKTREDAGKMIAQAGLGRTKRHNECRKEIFDDHESKNIDHETEHQSPAEAVPTQGHGINDGSCKIVDNAPAGPCVREPDQIQNQHQRNKISEHVVPAANRFPVQVQTQQAEKKGPHVHDEGEVLEVIERENDQKTENCGNQGDHAIQTALHRQRLVAGHIPPQLFKQLVHDQPLFRTEASVRRNHQNAGTL